MARNLQKKLATVLSLMLVLVMVLSACAPAAKNDTPANDTPAQDTQTSTTETPETTDTPAADTSADDAAKYNFAIVQGGIHPYYTPFPQALADVAADLGIPEPRREAVAFFNQEEQSALIESLIASGITGIAMQPADAVAGNEIISDMMDQGINVVGFAGPPEEPSDMIFCLATDTYTAAYEGAKQLCEEIGGKGAIVHLTSASIEPNTQKRIDGVAAALEEYPDVTLYQTIADIEDTESAQNAIESLMTSSADEIDGIMATSYVPSVVVSAIFTQRQETRIKAVLCDADDAVVQAIKDGWVTGTMNQNPYAQAYLCTLALKMMADGYTYKADSPFFIDSGFVYLNKDNIETKDEVARNFLETFKPQFIALFDEPAK